MKHHMREVKSMKRRCEDTPFESLLLLVLKVFVGGSGCVLASSW